ncbi:MAG: transketolase [Candidatus Thermoplasmatota archaeon]|nr:transketolase [Candidatus Thermoplasmatota archaeon]MCL5730829.1 transketolase [Candidatus Thermoplasmatota archaeon]
MKFLNDNDLRSIAEYARNIRRNSVMMVWEAKSGHPGGSLSIADILAVLYGKVMNIDPSKPSDPDRDRLIMSKGHASPALYSALAIRGFFPVSLLPGFRKLSSKLEGHVHFGVPGVEASTGSLGQGIGIAVGMAIAGKLDHKKYHVYAVVGDGEIEEGSVWESFMAGYKYSLNNLTVILDLNGVQLDGYTKDIMPTPDIAKKIRAFGWKVIEIDGHDYNQIYSALLACSRSRKSPTAIVAHTVKGKGVSYMENNPKYHGQAPETPELFQKAMEELS